MRPSRVRATSASRSPDDGSRRPDRFGHGVGSVAKFDSWHPVCSQGGNSLTLTCMDADNNNAPKLPEALGSAEYRARLTTKLNCLIAVLEVAITKITKSMDVPGANEERLLKIRSNLENTLSICHRARHTLDKTTTGKASVLRQDDSRSMTARAYVELTSIDEYRKFRHMPPISREELATIDFEELARRLVDG